LLCPSYGCRFAGVGTWNGAGYCGDTAGGTSTCDNPPRARFVGGYGHNARGEFNWPCPDAKIKAPANTVQLADSMCIIANHSDDGWPGNVSCRSNPPHNDGINMAFYDGHVKWPKKTGTFSNNAPCTSTEPHGQWTMDPND
jgi:prepilin-type processing-associated H-X9-DG protein